MKVAVASGLAKQERYGYDESRDCKLSFVEIMSCPGGCINGGGQPIKTAEIRNNYDVPAIRAGSIYNMDKNMSLRRVMQIL